MSYKVSILGYWNWAYVSFQFFGLPVEGVHDLPDEHRDDVDGDESSDNQIKLRIFHHLKKKKQKQIC